MRRATDAGHKTFSIGDQIGEYRILEELGRGGMGRVFKVEHTITRRQEAMKVLEGGRPDAPEQAARSLREIQVQASLDHPNIAAVLNAFCAGEDLVLVMELIEGRSLRRIMEAGRVPLAMAIGYSCQALAALSHAHAHGVIHRDVSPSNMMVGSTGVLKLTDFGLSKGPADLRLSQTGAPVGSLYYMPPEQIRGTGPVDARSDIYSLGVVVYELVTGKRPFDGESAFALMTDHVSRPPIPPLEVEPSLPPGLDHAILRALAKDPAERFPSAGEFRQALMRVKHSGAAPWRMSPTFLPGSWIIGVTAALAVVTIAMAGFFFSPWRHGLVNPPAAVVRPVPMQTPRESIPPPIAPAAIPVTVRPPVSRPTPARSARRLNDAMPAPEQQRVIPVAEPPPPLPPPEEHLVVDVADPTPPPPPEAGVEAHPTKSAPNLKPAPNRLEKGLSKLWRLVRRKKSSSEGGDSLVSSEKP